MQQSKVKTKQCIKWLFDVIQHWQQVTLTSQHQADKWWEYKKYHLGDKLTQYQTLWTNIMRIVWQTVRRIPKKFWINNTILTMELRSFQYTACMWWIMVLSVFFFFCYLSMKSKNNLPFKFPLKIFFQIIIIWDKGWKR